MTKSKTDFFKSKPLPFPPFCTYLHAEKIPELSNHMDKRMQIKCCRNRKKKKDFLKYVPCYSKWKNHRNSYITLLILILKSVSFHSFASSSMLFQTNRGLLCWLAASSQLPD